MCGQVSIDENKVVLAASSTHLARDSAAVDARRPMGRKKDASGSATPGKPA
jgi:hypothetical protein